MNYSDLYDTNTRTPNRVYLTETETLQTEIYTAWNKNKKNKIESLYVKTYK